MAGVHREGEGATSCNFMRAKSYLRASILRRFGLLGVLNAREVWSPVASATTVADGFRHQTGAVREVDKTPDPEDEIAVLRATCRRIAGGNAAAEV